MPPMRLMVVGGKGPRKRGAETAKAALHLTYTLGPGVLIGGQIASGSVEGSEDVTQFMLGTAVFF